MNESEVMMGVTLGVVDGIWSICGDLGRLDTIICSTIGRIEGSFTSSKRRRESIEGIELNKESSLKITS